TIDLGLTLLCGLPSCFVTPRFREIRGGFRIVERSLADPPAYLGGSQCEPKFRRASAFGLELFLVDRSAAGQNVTDHLSAQCARLLFQARLGQTQPLSLDKRDALNFRPTLSDRGWNVTYPLTQRVNKYWHSLAVREPPSYLPVNPVLWAILDFGTRRAHD